MEIREDSGFDSGDRVANFMVSKIFDDKKKFHIDENSFVFVLMDGSS
jgi:hypothetical protein